MITYQQFEKAIFDWLMAKNEMDRNFTFSTRLKANKGSELDYFIGTEKSGYFGFTFWNIPVDNGGSPMDLIDFFFELKENEFKYFIEFRQTLNPENKQNESALHLIKRIKDKISNVAPLLSESDGKGKGYNFKIGAPKKIYSNLEDLFTDLNNSINILMPIVDECIDTEKSLNPNFIAERISAVEFMDNQAKLENRIKKHMQLPSVLNNSENDLISILSSPSITSKFSSKPLNQILYGPPGTGKTFNTIDAAISIVNPQFDLKKERKEILEEYHRLVKTGNIVFTTFHQSMSYEDFIEGIKPLRSDSGDSVIYDIEAGLFKIACANAGYFCYQKSLENDKKQHKYTFDDLYDSFIEYYQELLENGTKFSFKTLTGKEVTIIHINSNDSIQARALHSTATKKPAPLTKENLQKLYDRFSSVDEITTLSQVQETVEVTPRTTEFYAVFKGLKEYEKSIFKPEEIESTAEIEVLDEKDKLKKFGAGVFKEAIKANSQNAEKVVMIIDEINRGNISAIFGELITLIEESKRLGKDEFLEITLPYSKKKFSVPANLYIIGTMNTADRSVEALDTALRRRFSFVEKLPNPERLKDKGEDENGNVGSINLPELLSVINARIEVLVDRDHTIGHAFFMDVKSMEDLKQVFADKIIPLLQEYFYGNYSKMEMVIGPNFFDEKNGKKPIQFAVQNNNIEVSETNYKLKNIHDDSFDLEKALKRLLNTSDSEIEKTN